MNQIQAYTRQPVAETQLPGAAEVQQKRDERLIEQVSGQLLAGINHTEKQLLEKLRMSGFNSDEVAVGMIRLLRANNGEVPIKELLEATNAGDWKTQTSAKPNVNQASGKLNKANGKDKMNAFVEPGMVRLWMSLGNRSGLRPGDIVGAIAGETGIPGNAIGEITIQPNYSLVDVMEKHVQSVLRHSKRSYRIKGKPVQIRLDDHMAG